MTKENDILTVEVEDVTNREALETSIAKISISSDVVTTTAFQKVLLDIPFYVTNADALLQAYRDDSDSFLENLDDDMIDAQLREMQNVSIFVKNVEKARLEIKRYMNGVRDTLIDELDSQLNSAQYDRLGKAQADIKQLKKDVEADRAARRWEELRPSFEANINRYPLLDEFAPELTDFSRFKLLFPKLVSGAKTRKVRQADHTVINETLHAWNTAIEIMKENIWELPMAELNELLTLFKREPSVELVNREGRQLKLNADAKEKARLEAKVRFDAEQKRVEEEAKKRQEKMIAYQEKERLAKISQNLKAIEDAKKKRLELEVQMKLAKDNEEKRKLEFNQFGGQYRTIFKESFPLFIKYLFENNNYHDVHSNPATKAGLIYDIMRQVDDSRSVVVKETANDPQKILDLVRYILDA